MSEEAALATAFAIGGKLTLPVTTRSLTVAEFRRNEALFVAVFVGIYVLFVGWIVIGLVLDEGEESRRILGFISPFSLLGLAVLAFIGRWRLKKYAHYRDHRITIEVTGGGVGIVWSGQSCAIDYEDVRYELYWQTLKGNTHFLGIRLETPLGPHDLIDRWFKGGRKAAAAIVNEHHKWHHLKRLA